MKKLKAYGPAIGIFLLFEAIAVTLWLTKKNPFYFLNFTYIGGCLSIGLALFSAQKPFARRFTQLAVGLYMLAYLGILRRENMQIEGFWYYLFSGVFEAATIHYAVAKIFGPLIFGRGWCGYACWTAMILDLLPFRVRQSPRRRLEWMRYVLFILSLVFVGLLFAFHVSGKDEIMFYAFLAGNLVYYGAGIAMAFAFRDNRAFCKYLCPVTVFLKPMSRFSLLRVRVDASRCVDCGKCIRACPMDVAVNREGKDRVRATECILCYECTKACPMQALK